MIKEHHQIITRFAFESIDHSVFIPLTQEDTIERVHEPDKWDLIQIDLPFDVQVNVASFHHFEGYSIANDISCHHTFLGRRLLEISKEEKIKFNNIRKNHSSTNREYSLYEAIFCPWQFVDRLYDLSEVEQFLFKLHCLQDSLIYHHKAELLFLEHSAYEQNCYNALRELGINTCNDLINEYDKLRYQNAPCLIRQYQELLAVSYGAMHDTRHYLLGTLHYGNDGFMNKGYV